MAEEGGSGPDQVALGDASLVTRAGCLEEDIASNGVAAEALHEGLELL
jgi:hypothetical protein